MPPQNGSFSWQHPTPNSLPISARIPTSWSLPARGTSPVVTRFSATKDRAGTKRVAPGIAARSLPNETAGLAVEIVLLRRGHHRGRSRNLRILVLRTNPLLGRPQSADDQRDGHSSGCAAAERPRGGARAEVDALRANLERPEAGHYRGRGREVRRARWFRLG